MARPVDTEIRPKILAACARVAMASDLRSLSLASLSQQVGVSPRMLIYHFGSAAALIEETLVGVQSLMREQLHANLIKGQIKDTRQALLQLWDVVTSPPMAQFFRSYYYLLSESLGDPQRHASFVDFSINGLIAWSKDNLAGQEPPVSDQDHTLICAVIRGLLIDYLATADLERTTQSFKDFLQNYRF